MTSRRISPSRWVLVALVLLLAVAVAFYAVTRDAQQVAETKTVEAEVEGAKADAAENTLDAICDAGDRAACRLLDQLDQVDETEPQDVEIQEPEVQESEVQEGERDDPERQDPDANDPESQESEKQDAESDDPEPDQPESQDAETQDDEVQDSEVDDPDKDDPETQDEEVQDLEVDDPDPNDPEVQDAETDDPDPASPFTFTFNFTVPSEIPNRPGTTYTVTCQINRGVIDACTVA